MSHDDVFNEKSVKGGETVELKVVDGNLAKAMRLMKRKLQQEGLFREMKKRRYYEKPSAKRKRKQKESLQRERKRQRKLDRFD
ncbi:ribosomal protein S21 [Desulfuromonas acetoxidans DSM 684]|uniref:Small ribosomal subunit protein bS21 n=1 Tax=Desulfuromonas acetoxidans (strain DSM 684 / 11070) TaxID=281689 RepID=Q1K3P0_DESA6|nr:30S ribosomal protein S21 [Desulfuromonas acetoxidans]EAT16934.1 ribosomal protein S21 [Desulfuromonas acetoxidans DSM 684]